MTTLAEGEDEQQISQIGALVHASSSHFGGVASVYDFGLGLAL
jgi:hypothetical protein